MWKICYDENGHTDCNTCKEGLFYMRLTAQFPSLLSTLSPPTGKEMCTHAELEAFRYRAKQEEKKIMQKYVKKKWTTGYHLFFSVNCESAVSFDQKSTTVALKWKQLDASEKQKYLNLANQKKQDIIEYIKLNATRLKSTIEKMQSHHDECKKPKRLNGFMMYLKDFWEQTKQTAGTIHGYQETRNIAVENWKQDESIRIRYNSLYKENQTANATTNSDGTPPRNPLTSFTF